MDVKAEVVLLIFTLNCVTLILLGQDMIRYRLCQDQFADYPACITAKVTTSPEPINIDNTIDTTTITTTTITPTTTTMTITISNNTVPVFIATTVPTTTTTTITTTPSFLITNLVPLRTQAPPPPPQQHQKHPFSPQQPPHQLLSQPPLPMNEKENEPLTPSSPPPPLPSSQPSPSSVDMNLNSRRYGDGTYDDNDEEDDLTKEVKTCGLITIATFVATSVASSQVLGRWIDRWSRRTMVLFPLTGVVTWAVCGLLVSRTASLPLYLWLVGAALGGSSGGFVTLKVAATIYAMQAAPQWDSTVRLALLQAATSLGVLIAYLGVYFLPADPQLSMTNVFLGITVLGILNVLFVFIFFADKPPTTPVPTTTTTTTTITAITTAPGDAPGTQIIVNNSSSSLGRYVPREEGEEDDDQEQEGGNNEDDGEDDNDKDQKENVGKMGKYDKEMLTEAGMERYECKGKETENDEKAITLSIEGATKDDDVGTRMLSSFPIDNLVMPPQDEKQERMKYTADSTQRSKRKRKLGVMHSFVHLTVCNEEDERPPEPETKHAGPSSDYGSLHLLPRPIPIIISSEDGSSVYGTPPEHSNLPVSRCGTPPSPALSYLLPWTSLETTTAAPADGQQCGVLTRQQQPEESVGASCYDSRGEQENRLYYERPRHQIARLSSSAPSTFPSFMEARSDAAPHIPLDKTQTVNKPRISDSQDDMMMTPNVLLTPASSLGSVLGCKGSNSSSSSSSSSGESRDVMRGDERDSLYDCASLGDMQGLSQPSANTANTPSCSYDSTSLREPGSIMAVQSEGVGEVGEREGRGPLAPLTAAGESSGEGMYCAGGGGAERCLACVAGRLLCRPVSVTFRRRAAGLRGIVVADVVAAFLVSVVAAGVWEVTPLYLEAKMEWSLADWVSYLACRSGLGVVALVVLLPLLRRRLSLQDTTLGVLGGLSSLLSSVCLSSLSSSPSVIPLALLFGPLTLYLNVASAAILVRLVGVTELGGVLLCLGSVEQAGHVTGWLTFHYLFPLLLRHRMPGVAFLATGFLLLVPSTIFGALYFSLGLRSSSSPHTERPASHRRPSRLS